MHDVSETSPFSLRGKRVLVTGASSGLGRQTSIACAAMGASMIVTGRNPTRLAETFDALAGEGHCQVCLDLAAEGSLDALVRQSGKVDGVVHSAGVPGTMPMRQVSLAFSESVFRVNFHIPICLNQKLLAKQHINKRGSLLFLSSISAFRAVHGVGIYSATKAALIAAVKCLALEVAKHGIRANCLAPDLVETPMLAGAGTMDSPTEWLESQRAQHPLGLGTPADVANAAIFYLSDASRWVTGTALIMDGGMLF